jgi:Flp pilus assembly protein TadG
VGPARRFFRANSGVSAVEFALIAPLMILLFFGLGELGQGLMAQRRTSHIASTIGDLSAQATTLHQSDITDIFSVANIMMAPLPTSTLKMRITSVTAGNDANKTPKVDWSKGQGLSDLGTGTTVTVPVGLLTASGDSVIMAESTYTYASPVGVVLPHGLNFSETFYFRPRKSTNVTYSP